jgi:uncharacterized repeat protein (TIGR01451 family)
MSARRLLAVPFLVGIVALLASAGAPASTPSSSSVTVPTSVGTTVRDTPAWTGTAPAGTNTSSDCTPPAATAPTDEHTIAVTVPAGVYNTLDATFKFNITWTPPADPTAADLILTVVAPDGQDIASSDGGSPTETVSAVNLPAGNYKMVICGFVNAAPQTYQGKVEITTATKEPSLASAPTQGLAFSAAVAADNQRDESEPLIEIDKAGNMYGCGPTGSSQAADYHQVSLDGGDQFHLIGVPPRGQAAGGGGGDCAMATGPTAVGGTFPYAYAGLGPLTGFATAVSPDLGHRIATAGGDAEGGVTNEGGVADRQWSTFLDDNNTVLMIYNQQAPRNTVVIKSTNGGLTFATTDAKKGARNPRFPGPIRYIPPSAGYPNGIAYFAWDRAGSDGDHINLSISQNRGATWTDCLAAVAAGNTGLFPVADHDNAGHIYVGYNEQARFHTYVVSLTAARVRNCNESVDATSELPTTNPGFSAPVQADRDAVRTTVFPWIVAGGAPGRVAVEFVGTETDGNPNSGAFKASWDIYVSQSLNMLDAGATFAQVKVTTHPMHYDSICLNGLGCDLAVPPGDRSLADFFAIDVQPGANGKLAVIFDRANKKPDESSGHVASPMVAVQIGGPTNGGGSLTPPASRAVVRSSSTDPSGDALSSWSAVAPLTLPPAPTTTNEPAADFLSLSIGPELDLATNAEVANGGFTATIKVADLSTSSLQNTMARTQSQSLLWVLRFTNGYQDAAASARWNPVDGFTFGFNDYSTGTTPCASPAGSGEKCLLYPGGTAIAGDVNQGSGTIRLSVPRSLLRTLTGSTGAGQRPSEVPATVGSRLYDATMFSLGNTNSATQNVQSFLYPFDNTPSMDFLVPGAVTADLSLTKSDSPDPVKGGQNLSYTIVVTNNGPSTATGVVMTDQLPKNAGFASATTTTGSCAAKPDKSGVTCNIGDLANGASATIKIVVKSPTTGPISNTAGVTATSTDPNSPKTSDTETTTVR